MICYIQKQFTIQHTFIPYSTAQWLLRKESSNDWLYLSWRRSCFLQRSPLSCI